MRANSGWTRLLVHKIPTTLGEDTATIVSSFIIDLYPQIQFAQPSRWLTATDKWVVKTHSTIVLSLPSSYRMDSLGIWFFPLFNTLYCLSLYKPAKKTDTTTPNS